MNGEDINSEWQRVAQQKDAEIDTLRGTRDLFRQQRNQLRAALVGLIGVDGREELEQMELVMRLEPAIAEDKIAAVNAIHALLATL